MTLMKAPWLKKNPFMSIWLSGANKVAGAGAGAAPGLATAAVRREANWVSKDAAAQETKQVLDFRGAAAARAAPKPKAKPKVRNAARSQPWTLVSPHTKLAEWFLGCRRHGHVTCQPAAKLPFRMLSD